MFVDSSVVSTEPESTVNGGSPDSKIGEPSSRRSVAASSPMSTGSAVVAPDTSTTAHTAGLNSAVTSPRAPLHAPASPTALPSHRAPVDPAPPMVQTGSAQGDRSTTTVAGPPVSVSTNNPGAEPVIASELEVADAVSPPKEPLGSPAKKSKNTISRRDLGGRKQRFEAKKTRRLIRHVDPWSILKMSLVLGFCLWLMVCIAAVIIWSVAKSSGSIGKIESLVSDNGLPGWKMNGQAMFRQFGLIGLVFMFAGTAAATVASIVFNLVSDIIGGIWITVIEEETARPVSK